LAGALLVSATYSGGRWRHALFACMGAAVGCLLLTKINMGIFAGLALALSSTAGSKRVFVRFLQVLVWAGVVFLPWVLLRSHLDSEWGACYAAIFSLSLMPVLGELHSANSCPLRASDYLAVVAGFLISVILPVAAVLIRGTTVAELWEGTVWQHRHFAAFLSYPAETSPAGIAAALASIAGYWLFRAGRLPALGIAILKASLGCFIFYEAYWLEHGSLINYALPFAWLALVPIRYRFDGITYFSRQLLVSLAVLQSLAGYPVFGTQRALATVFLNCIAGLCLADVCSEAARRRALILGKGMISLALQSALILALLGWYWWFVPRTYSDYAVALLHPKVARLQYEHAWPLNLPGAHRVRMDSERRMAALQWLSYNLRRAQSLATIPGQNSLYIWAGLDQEPELNYPAWLMLLDQAHQQRALDVLQGQRRAYAVRVAGIIDEWLLDERGRSAPLVRYVDQDYRTVASFGGYQLRVRTTSLDPELYGCVRPPKGSAQGSYRLVIPPMPGHSLGRVMLYDISTNQVIGDSRKSPDARLIQLQEVIDGVTRRLDPAKLSIGLERSRILLVDYPFQRSTISVGPLTLRLFDADGQWFASLPVLD
jgi:hypothetical protein